MPQYSLDSDQSIVVPNGQMAVRIGIQDLEGATKIVIEQQEDGKAATMTELKDFRKGYFLTSVDPTKRTRVTAIAYNANGSTRGNTLTFQLTASTNGSDITTRGASPVYQLTAISDDETTGESDIDSYNRPSANEENHISIDMMNNDIIEYYSLDGRKLQGPAQNGIYLMKQNGKVSKHIAH